MGDVNSDSVKTSAPNNDLERSQDPIINDPFMSQLEQVPDINNNNASTPLFSFEADIIEDHRDLQARETTMSDSDFTLPFAEATTDVLNSCNNNNEQEFKLENIRGHIMRVRTETIEEGTASQRTSAAEMTLTTSHHAPPIMAGGVCEGGGCGYLEGISTADSPACNQQTRLGFAEDAALTNNNRNAVLKRKLTERPSSGGGISYCVRQKEMLYLDAYVASIGPYKIDVTALVLSPSEIHIRVERNILDSGLYKVASVNTLVLPKSDIIQILSHFPSVSTSALFIYISPSLALQVYHFIQKSDNFRQNSTTGNANGYNLIAILLHTMSPGKTVKCREILTKFGTKDNPILQAIEFKTAGEYIKACFNPSKDNSYEMAPPVMTSSCSTSRSVAAVGLSSTAGRSSDTPVIGSRPSQSQQKVNISSSSKTEVTLVKKPNVKKNNKIVKGKSTGDKRKTRSDDGNCKNVITIN